MKKFAGLTKEDLRKKLIEFQFLLELNEVEKIRLDRIISVYSEKVNFKEVKEKIEKINEETREKELLIRITYEK